MFAEEVDTEYMKHSKNSKKDVAIKIENGNFYWVKDVQKESQKKENNEIQLQEVAPKSQLILKDINMKIEKGSFVAILGE